MAEAILIGVTSVYCACLRKKSLTERHMRTTHAVAEPRYMEYTLRFLSSSMFCGSGHKDVHRGRGNMEYRPNICLITHYFYSY